MTPPRLTLPLQLLVVPLAASCFKDDGGPPPATGATAAAPGGTTEDPPTTGLDPDPDPSSSTTGPDDDGTSTTTTTATTEATAATGTTDAEEITLGSPQSECGDGIVEGMEGCDDGPNNADDGLCTSACQKAKCFDGLVQPILGEECDQGVKNDDGGACLTNCKKATCGDGHVFVDVEECDKGEANQAGVYNGCTPMSCTFGPRCGDDILDKPFEECDHGDKNGDPGDMCSGACTFNGDVVFVTSATYTGVIAGPGGVKAADDQCNTLAMEAGLPNAGAFRAWVSAGTQGPGSWNPKPAGPFILLDGTEIAGSWADLTDGSLLAPISINELSAAIGDDTPFAWTGTTSAGLAIPSQTCADWTSGIKEDHGAIGNLKSVDKGWSNYALAQCFAKYRLICVET